MSDYDPMPSGSRLDRAEHCPASQALPAAADQGPYAEGGTAGHDFMHAVLKVGRMAALAATKFPDAAMIPIEDTPLADPLGMEGEIRFGWNVDTGAVRRFGPGDRPQSGEFHGRLDLVRMMDVFIGDYKFGWKDARPAQENLQIGFGAHVVTKLAGEDDASGALVYIRGASVQQDKAYWGPFDLDTIEERLRDIAAKVRSARRQYRAGHVPSVQTGPWCGYCPAMSYCPAYKALISRMSGELQDFEQELTSCLTQAQAAEGYRRLLMAKQAIGLMEQRFMAWATANPIDLGDGTVLEKRTKERLVLDGAKTFAVLSARYGKYGSAPALAGMKVKTSKAGIRRAIVAAREQEPGLVITKELGKILKELEDNGGGRLKPITKVRVFKQRAANATVDAGEDDDGFDDDE